MSAMDLPSAAHKANSTPPTVTTRPRLGGHWLRWIPLALAALWLIASVSVGIHLIQDKPSEGSTLDVSTPRLSASSDHVYYGGDAYTGIQNAAADTEHAVVEGVNQSAAFQLALEQAIADQESQQSSDAQSEVQKGLGYLVIGIGVLTFMVALPRSRRSD